jgi:FAD/FMN-containing dehydrogenase
MFHNESKLKLSKEEKIQGWSKVPDSAFAKYGLTREKAEALERDAAFKLVWVWDSESEYDKSRAQYDPAYSEYPLVVGYAQMAAHVEWLLTFARLLKTPFPVSCRSGGHNTAGYSVLPNGVVIDMSLFTQIQINEAAKTATVGPGVNFASFNTELDRYGLHTPGGDCQDVCMGGYMQGGGYGLTSREFGMNCDNVTAFTMMTYDSAGAHIVTASPTQNPQLFWAVRGGTGNQFGVLLDVTYQLYPLGPIWGFGIKWMDLNDAPAALLAMQNGLMKTGASPKIGYMSVIMVQDGDTEPSLGMWGLFDGSRTDGLAQLQPLLSLHGAKLVFDKVSSYLDLDANMFPNPNLPKGFKPPPPEVKQSAYIDKPIDLAGWTAIVQHFATRLNDTSAVILEPYGGAINSYAGENAFIHRDVYMDLFVDSFFFKPDEWDAANAWLDGYMKIIEPYSNGQQYQNYPRRNTADYPKAFWGDAYPALQRVKAQYDPLNVFQFPMGIHPPGQPRLMAHAAAGRVPAPAAAAAVHPAEAAPVFEAHYEEYKKRRGPVKV